MKLDALECKTLFDKAMRSYASKLEQGVKLLIIIRKTRKHLRLQILMEEMTIHPLLVLSFEISLYRCLKVVFKKLTNGRRLCVWQK